MWKLVYLLNLLTFFSQGRFPSVAERLAGLRMVDGGASDGASDGTAASAGAGAGADSGSGSGSATPSTRTAPAGRTINFQFMNRQLLWEAMTQFFLFVVPLLDRDLARRAVDRASRSGSRLRRDVRRRAAEWWETAREQLTGGGVGDQRAVGGADGAGGPDTDADGRVRQANEHGGTGVVQGGLGQWGERLRAGASALGFNAAAASEDGRGEATPAAVGAAAEGAHTSAALHAPPGGCVACGAAIATMPYVTDCAPTPHTFCYYCLKTACMNDDAYRCPSCGSNFTSSRPWSAVPP